MSSEYIASLADVSFHIVAYMYARFRYSGKSPMRFAVFLAYFCAVLRFSDPPYAPLYRLLFINLHSPNRHPVQNAKG